MLIRIFLHGLILFAPQQNTHMLALFADGTQQLGMDQKCFVKHQPTVDFPYVNVGDCALLPGCVPDKPTGGYCNKCDITRMDVFLLPDTNPTPSTLQKHPGSHLPPPDKTGPFAYIVNLTELNTKDDESGTYFSLNQNYMKADLPPIALIHFAFDSLRTCSFAIRDPEGVANAHSFAFRRVATTGVGQLTQALGQTVLAKVTVPQGSKPALYVVSFGGAKQTIPIRPDSEINIILANDRLPPALQTDDACEDGVGRDFAFLYELLLPKTAWTERPIPHVRYSELEQNVNLQSAECDLEPKKLPMSRPICPPGAVVQ